jgi:hypothetical protein
MPTNFRYMAVVCVLLAVLTGCKKEETFKTGWSNKKSDTSGDYILKAIYTSSAMSFSNDQIRLLLTTTTKGTDKVEYTIASSSSIGRGCHFFDEKNWKCLGMQMEKGLLYFKKAEKEGEENWLMDRQ